MSHAPPPQTITTGIWLEEPEADNAFATRAAFCRGYDVYGEMLGRSRWVEMLWLLFRAEAPSAEQAALLETLAIALANAGPRDAAVHAAMCAGVGGSTAAAALMAALAVGAGSHGGAREVFLAMQGWDACGTDIAAWRTRFAAPADGIATIWPECDHAPGFDPHGAVTATIVRQVLSRLAACGAATRLTWLHEHRAVLEAAAGAPLAMSGVAAAAFADLGFSAQQGEMLFLLLRLPGAAAHALEQRDLGHKRFPFFAIESIAADEASA